MYYYEIQWENGWRDTVEADSLAEAVSLAEEMTREGEWGDHGARVRVTVTGDDDANADQSEELDVEIPPDHRALIAEVTRDHDPAILCGPEHEDHDWTGEGEGGCHEHPGVWSTGGTSLRVHRHCRRCPLALVERLAGSAPDPGEADTIEYHLRDDQE